MVVVVGGTLELGILIDCWVACSVIIYFGVSSDGHSGTF